MSSQESREAIAKVFDDILCDLQLDCPQCGDRLKLGLENMQLFWDRGELRCIPCDVVLPLFDPSHVDWEIDAQSKQPGLD